MKRAASFAALFVLLGAAAPTKLPSYNIDPAKVFVAGFSGGGFAAVQLDVAYSGTFKGAAIYAGGVYHCAEGDVLRALQNCGGTGAYGNPLGASLAYLDKQSTAGTIDPSSNLKGQQVYLWSGTSDNVVVQKAVDDLATEYQHYGAVVTYDKSFPAQHAWESPDGPLACGALASPFIVSCSQGGSPYDSEKTWLTLLFGKLQPRNNGTLTGTLINFDQREFGRAEGLDSNGWAFVPQACASGHRCGLVVVLSGCAQHQRAIGNTFAVKSGINEWADTNDIVVLYPYQAETDDNPNGCWDWWGYGSADYSLRRGPQMAAIYAMVRRAMGG